MDTVQLTFVLTNIKGDLRLEAETRGNWFDLKSHSTFNSHTGDVSFDETIEVPIRSNQGHDFTVTGVNPGIGWPRIEIRNNKTGQEKFYRLKVGESVGFDNMVDGLRLSGWRDADDDRNDFKCLRVRIESL
jgi:hypothetical protein